MLLPLSGRQRSFESTDPAFENTDPVHEGCQELPHNCVHSRDSLVHGKHGGVHHDRLELRQKRRRAAGGESIIIRLFSLEVGEPVGHVREVHQHALSVRTGRGVALSARITRTRIAARGSHRRWQRRGVLEVGWVVVGVVGSAVPLEAGNCGAAVRAEGVLELAVAEGWVDAINSPAVVAGGC